MTNDALRAAAQAALDALLEPIPWPDGVGTLARVQRERIDACASILRAALESGDPLIDARAVKIAVEEVDSLDDELKRAAADAIESLRAERDVLAADATRYRRLCDAGLPLCFAGHEYQSKAEFDAAIDAAMKGESDD